MRFKNMETKCYRKNGKIFIEIPEKVLIDGLKTIDFKAVDKEAYLNYFAANILDSGDDGEFESCSDFTRMIDNLVEEAFEDEAGVERI
jgi:hypothetical protein